MEKSFFTGKFAILCYVLGSLLILHGIMAAKTPPYLVYADRFEFFWTAYIERGSNKNLVLDYHNFIHSGFRALKVRLVGNSSLVIVHGGDNVNTAKYHITSLKFYIDRESALSQDLRIQLILKRDEGLPKEGLAVNSYITEVDGKFIKVVIPYNDFNIPSQKFRGISIYLTPEAKPRTIYIDDIEFLP